MKISTLLISSFLLLPSFAGPTVTSFSQDPDTLEVTVKYTLDAPAIVTVDFQKKDGDTFKSIGEENFTKLSGDVNRYIETTGAHTLKWMPDSTHGTGSGDTAISAANFKVVLKAWSRLDPPDYLCVNLCVSNSVFYYVSSNAVPHGVLDERYMTDWMLMRRIPAKGVTWKMGSPESDKLRTANLETQHEVTLTEDYWMGVFEVTQAQGLTGAGQIASGFINFDISYKLPISNMGYYGWRGEKSVCDWPNTPAGALHSGVGGFLKTIRGRTGVEFDLPTEAQWEYACRAGTGTQYCWPHLSFDTTSAANPGLAKYAIMTYSNEPVQKGTPSSGPVGMYMPNKWGLYDMHGNIREWCLDYIDPDSTMSADPVTNPQGPTSAPSDKRVWRGGGWTSGGAQCRSAYREASSELSSPNAYLGARLMAPIGLKW